MRFHEFMIRESTSAVTCALIASIPWIVWAGPIEDLRPGEWYEVPGSKLDEAGVYPDPLPPGYGTAKNVIEAWSGGAFDSKRHRLIIWGGGHGDYGGNEIYVFDVDTFGWSRIWGPSPNIPEPGGSCKETYDDGNPASRHTYDGLQYITVNDTFWAQGGSLYCGSGGGGSATWEFNLETLVWERKTDAPSTMLGVVSAYDPVTGHVFHQGQNKFSEYDPSTGNYTVIGNEPDAGWWSSNMTAALDPERRLFVAVGMGKVRVWNLATKQYSEVSTTGGSQIVEGNAPGFEYDPVIKKFVAWNGGAEVYSLDMDTLTWSVHPPADTNTVVPTDPAHRGTYGRFRYMPSKNAYIVVNSVYENVFIYRLSDALPPDTTPPAPPVDLKAR